MSMSQTRSLPTTAGVVQPPPIDAKLRPSLLPSPTVRRTRLVNRLRASSAPVVTVVAPAGYGKTTLLAQWIERDSRPAAWLNATEDDDGEARLQASVANAIDSLSAGGRPNAERDGTSLILVIDDVHLLRSSGARRALSALAEELPPGSTLALAGRREPCVPIARLRTRGHVFELGAADLAMNGHEGRALLSAAGVDTEEKLAAELVQRTEGWAAGVHLAALRVDAPERLLQPTASGVDRFVVDYFRLEVLSELAEDTLEFLTRASAFDTMCGPLCDSVLDRSDSTDMLEELERAQLFLVPLDRCRVWYRFHTLFRSALRAELERREPGCSSRLGTQAAEWFETNGMLDAAVDQAQTAGDVRRMTRLVAVLGAPALFRGRIGTVLRWLDGIGGGRARSAAPQIAALGAWAHALRGSPLEALRWEATLSAEPAATPRPSWSGLEEMRRRAELSVARLPVQSAWKPVALTLLGIAQLLEGDADRADASLAEAVERAEVIGVPAFAALGLAERALLALARGDHAIADEHANRAYEIVRGSGLDRYATSALVFAAAARVALRGGASTRTRDAISRATDCIATRSQPLPWLSVQTWLELARVRIALADTAGAASALDRADLTLAETDQLGVLGDQARELRRQLDAIPTATGLTSAELRLLPLLATHLSFREIAERLFLSRNTVKTQAISVYRKLGVSSRSDAISRAGELGLVDTS